MGRKVEMKKIEDVTKCQVTFSKRRSSLIKKADEIAVCCDVDVVFIAFSPSGRVSKYCNNPRIEDVLNRYVNLLPESRLTHIENVQGKVEKLEKLSSMPSEIIKKQYLDKRIENLQLQIMKKSLELQIAEADLRDYEVAPGQELSLHHLSWCERNLNRSLEKVKARMVELENQTGSQHSSNIKENELALITQNGQAGDVMMELDPWTSPYGVDGTTGHESLFQDLVDQANIAAPTMNHAGPSHMYNFPLPDSSIILESGFTNMTYGALIPFQQSSMVDPLPDLPDQINDNAWNNFSSVSFPDAAHVSTQTLCDFLAPRFTSTTMITHNASNAEVPQSLYNEIGTSSQFANSNFNQINMEGGEPIGQQFMNFENTLNNTNALNGTTEVDGSGGMNSSQMQQMQAPSEYLQPEKDFCQDPLFDNMHQDASGQNMRWTSNTQKNDWTWDLEEFLFNDNFQTGESSKR